MRTMNNKPNVVLIVLDTHRVDRLGCYGSPCHTSPNIDEFSSKATIFANAISPAQWTIPSHASLFSGEFPAKHLTLQAYDSLAPSITTLAERLLSAGYRTAGFCNNPLVGVLDNGFRRGFQAFYNYGGAAPRTLSQASQSRPSLVGSALCRIQRLFRRFANRTQNLFTRPNILFRLAMTPLLVPFWTRYARFKGNTVQSIQDTRLYLEQICQASTQSPSFVFLNLMQTHLPFAPPQDFVNRFAPIMRKERGAREFMHSYNRQAVRWMFPQSEPFTDLEATTLSSMYNAEVAYQDHLLADLFEILAQPYHSDQTMVIVMSDHGTMLGEHQLLGHGLGVYEELAHVPLIIRFPGKSSFQQVVPSVSTRQVFHTILDVATSDQSDSDCARHGEVRELSLNRTYSTPDCLPPVFSEAYPSATIVQMIESHAPELLQVFPVRSTARAVYDNGYKLIDVEGVSQDLYALEVDPHEQRSLNNQSHSPHIERLASALHAFLEQAQGIEPGIQNSTIADADESVRHRLRGLGYLD